MSPLFLNFLVPFFRWMARRSYGTRGKRTSPRRGPQPISWLLVRVRTWGGVRFIVGRLLDHLLNRWRAPRARISPHSLQGSHTLGQAPPSHRYEDPAQEQDLFGSPPVENFQFWAFFASPSLCSIARPSLTTYPRWIANVASSDSTPIALMKKSRS